VTQLRDRLACCRFVTATGRPAAIGSLSDATAILTGTAGTTISAIRVDAIPAPAGI
jgi:carbamate kinase